MIVRDAEFNRSELQAVEEQIYSLTAKKKRCLFDLDQVRFHERYLVQRRDFIETKFRSRIGFMVLPIIIILFFIFNSSIYKKDAALGETISGPQAVLGLCGSIFCFFLVIFVAYLIWDLIRLSNCLQKFSTIEQANAYSKRKHIITLQKDEYDTRESLLLLQEQLANTEAKLEQLQKDREVLREKERQMAAEKSGEQQTEFGFKLNPNYFEDLNRETAIEAYTYEIKRLTKNIDDYETKLMFLDKKFDEVEKEFANVKEKVKMAGVFFLCLIVAQSFFRGTLYTVTSFICFAACLIGALLLEKKLEKPILDYLVEQGCPYIQSYIFCNNIVPIYQQKSQINEFLEADQKSLAEFKERMLSLEK